MGLTLFAFQTKWDFTVMGGVLFVALIVFMIFGIVAIFLPGKTMTLVYSSLGALLFSFYLIYDTQLIIGGKHKYSISPEEYIFAALNLYLDVINIFIYILSILGASRNWIASHGGNILTTTISDGGKDNNRPCETFFLLLLFLKLRMFCLFCFGIITYDFSFCYLISINYCPYLSLRCLWC